MRSDARRRRARTKAGGGALALAVLVSLTGPGPLPAQARDGVVEARLAGGTARFRVHRHHAYPAINADDLGAAGLRDLDRSGAFLRARLGARELWLEAGSPFFTYGDMAYQLANPPYSWGGSFWVPAELVTDWLPRRSGVAARLEETPAEAAGPLPDRVDPNEPWRVIIDAGHGGRDPGTLGRNSREKDVVLAIALALRDELAGDPDFETSLTRDDDTYVKHDIRSAMAVERGGDLFVSIHANSAPSRSASGFETIFLGPARSEEARAVAIRENRTPDVDSDGPGSTDELLFILTGLDRTENLSESRRFAGFVQNALRGARGREVPDRGVKQGPWWVLLGALARMPSVIVEVGFLSNAEEERFLRSADGQRAVARAVARAIRDYRKDLLRRFSAARGTGEN